MKLTYTCPSGRLTFEAEVPHAKAAFEAVAGIQEIFEEPGCGCCQATELRCRVREVRGYKFFELVCCACGARLSIGQSKDLATLFPRRVDKDGAAIGEPGARGWYVYNGHDTPEPEPAPRPLANDRPTAPRPPANGRPLPVTTLAPPRPQPPNGTPPPRARVPVQF